MVLPIAVFVAALVALNRLHTEQEIVVCFSGGMSRWRVISPAMRLAAGVALLMLILNLWVQPAAYREMRRELFQVKADLAATLVREGEFAQPAPGLTVYAQSVDSAGNLENLFIHQVKSDGSDTTYSAEKGRIARSQGRPVLVLTNGSNQQLSSRGVLNYLTFRSYTFDLSPLANTEELIHYKPSDRYMHELFFPDLQQDWERRNRLSMLSEGHSRLATPLYNIAFMALALWAILGGGFSRLGYGRRIAAMGATAAVIRILGFQVEAASEDSAWLNILQYAVPLGATWFALAGIFRKPVARKVSAAKSAAAVAGARA
jgi:lipopolysaccharide export system permease protein